MGQNIDIRDTFFLECEDLIEALRDGLCDIESALGGGRVDAETINAVFRAVHSIKGGAGAFGLEVLVRFAHHVETVLDALRSGRLGPDVQLLHLLHRAGDHLSDLVIAARDDTNIAAATSAPLIASLTAALGDQAEIPAIDAQAEDFGFVPLALSLNLDLPRDEGDPPPQGPRFTIAFKPKRALYANGHDPSVLFHLLADLGPLDIRTDTSQLPPFDDLDWQNAYLGWTITLRTTEPEHVIHEVFEFVDGLCALEIAPLANTMITAPILAIAAPTAPAATGPQRPPPGSGAAQAPHMTVRVDLDRVDRLINVVGELVINQAMLSQCVQAAGISPRSDIGAGLDDFRTLAREIQESVMAIRAQAIKPLFQRMSRIVREACDASGKRARLLTLGEMTEVDKTVIERLADPLTHMIRNAIDHGIESPADRIAAGKSDTGSITLSAAHRSGRVLIEVSDDGAGIDRARAHQTAVTRGLIAEGTGLSDAEIDELLFLPGFSTAGTVSDLSGRGVGMDVVNSAVRALGGRVTIGSVPGKGTTFSISLPLTLAVLDGMVVDVAGQIMVVPVTAIMQTLRPCPQDLHDLGTQGQLVSIRGNFVPIIDLGAVFGHRAPVREFCQRVLLLVETDQHAHYALVVDAVHDQRQVVIKGLDGNYGRIAGIAAATILGDGSIALIIDPQDAIHQASGGLDFRRATPATEE